VLWLLLLAYGLIWLVAAIVLGVRTPSPDWQAFHRTGLAVLDGTTWYVTPVGAVPNLTPPLIAPVFAGLALLPIRLAFLVWTTIGLAAGLWAARRIADVWGRPTWQVAAALLACHGMPLGLILGQLHLTSFVLVTAAWRADREDRPSAAGIWLGAAIYLKPFLALVLVYWMWRRSWRAAGAATAVAGAGYAMGLLWLPTATAGWVEGLRSVTWQHTSVNLAVWGLVARLDLSPRVGVGLAAAVLGLLLWRLPSLTRDGAWCAVLAAACLVSPIAWLYYALMLLGPLGLLYQHGTSGTRRLLEIGYVGLCVQLAFQEPAALAGGFRAATLGSWYFWAFACWWLAALRQTSDFGRQTSVDSTGMHVPAI
jgi:alpha-1,2-mannosyltransferase